MRFRYPLWTCSGVGLRGFGAGRSLLALLLNLGGGDRTEAGAVFLDLVGGLLAAYAVSRGATAVVRGVRDGTDFDAEYQLALINRGIHEGLETLFLPASPAFRHFSSSMAREMIRYRQPLENYLPGAVIPLVRDMMK